MNPNEPYQPMPKPMNVGLETAQRTERNTGALVEETIALRKRLEQVEQEFADYKSEQEAKDAARQKGEHKRNRREWVKWAITTGIAVLGVLYAYREKLAPLIGWIKQVF